MNLNLESAYVARPERIWKSREKGWIKPPNTVVVDRRSKWGNPFAKKLRGGEDGLATMTREMLCDEYRHWLTTPTRRNRTKDGSWVQMSHQSWPSYLGVPFEGRPSIEEIRAALAGKNLACDCHLSQPCHAEVLLEIANGVDRVMRPIVTERKWVDENTGKPTRKTYWQVNCESCGGFVAAGIAKPGEQTAPRVSEDMAFHRFVCGDGMFA